MHYTNKSLKNLGITAVEYVYHALNSITTNYSSKLIYFKEIMLLYDHSRFGGKRRVGFHNY
jgi:hypothetical protein